jgi:hypothetical protein
MAIDIDNPQLGNINANINTNVNLNEGATIANAYNRLGNIIGNFGKEISTKYGYEYGKEQAISDIRNNLDKGADGAYNHVSMLTPYGQAYNQTMDKITPAVLTAQYGSKLLQYANEIKSSNIPNNQKVEEYSKGVKPLIDDSVKQISPEYRDQVALMLTQQAGQDQKQLIQHTAAIDSQNQALASYDALNKNLVLAEEAAKNKDISLANNYLSQNYNIIGAAVNTGVRSANEAKSLQQYSTRKVLTDIALANGITSAVDLNNNLPEEKRLSGDEISKIQETLDNNFLAQQKAIKIDQLRHNIDVESIYSKAFNGEIFSSPVPLNIEQNQEFYKYVDAGSFFRQAKDVPPDTQEQMKASKQFTSLPFDKQRFITTQLEANNKAVIANPVDKLHLPKDYPLRVTTLAAWGIEDLSKMNSTQEQLQFNSDYQKDPMGTIQKIEATQGQYAPITTKAISKANNALGLNISDPHLKDDYLLGTTLPNQGKYLDMAKLDQDVKDTMAILPQNTNLMIYDSVLKIGNVHPDIPRNDLTKQIYTFDHGSFVYKSDEEVLTMNGRIQLAKIIGSPNAEYNIANAQIDNVIQLDPVNNVYNIYNRKNLKVPLYTIPRSKVQEIQSVSIFKKIDNFFER